MGAILRKNQIFSLGILAIAVFFLVLYPFAAWAEMELISDENLKEVRGQGVISFTRDGDTLKAAFDIGIETYTQIDSFKLGYYNDGTSLGWDQDWTNVSLGSPSKNLEIHGFYIQAVFYNIDDPATRGLQSVTIGTTNMSGTISATFNSFSGDIAAGNPVSGHRITPVFTEVSCTGTGFTLTLSESSAVSSAVERSGFRVHWDQATTS